MLNVMRRIALPYRGADAGRITLRVLNDAYISQNITVVVENFIQVCSRQIPSAATFRTFKCVPLYIAKAIKQWIMDISGSHQYCLAVLPSETVGEGNENLVYPSPRDFKITFTYRKILQHGASGFTPHPKKGVLRIFISLKNPSPWLDSNPQPLSPVASTLTTTPPRRRPSSSL
jgi:hypothetical protein